jgi:uracil-DNA glycosylase
MQPRVRHLLRGLDRDPRRVPASNVVFVRTAREADLAAEKAALLEACWPLHQAVIDGLGIRTILCFGGTAGAWVRERLQAHGLAGSFVERNARRWRSLAHLDQQGRCVVTLTHPSIAKWDARATYPTPFVRAMLAR